MVNVKGSTRNILLAIGIVLLIFLMWYFSSIVAYVLLSAVLSLVGRPLVRFLQRIKIGRFRLSKSLSALFTLIILWVVFIGFFRFLIPLLMNEFEQLSTINLKSIINEIEGPVHNFMDMTGTRPAGTENWSFPDIIKDQLGEKIGFSQLKNGFSLIAGAVGSFFIASFSVSFITFFFLREENMFKEGLLLFVPSGYEEKISKIFNSVSDLLKRYFIGLAFEVFMVGFLVMVGLTIIGLGFSHAVVIGLFCGLFNIIPYLGPWMGAAIGLLIGIAINIHADFMSHTFPLLGLMLIVFVVVQIADNIIFQPLIYSSSVKAHPLEIFLVILIAGNVAGISGMILAIPLYTILRVIASEFLGNLKIVRTLTKNLK